jgi:hypothetical protein
MQSSQRARGAAQGQGRGVRGQASLGYDCAAVLRIADHCVQQSGVRTQCRPKSKKISGPKIKILTCERA